MYINLSVIVLSLYIPRSGCLFIVKIILVQNPNDSEVEMQSPSKREYTRVLQGNLNIGDPNTSRVLSFNPKVSYSSILKSTILGKNLSCVNENPLINKPLLFMFVDISQCFFTQGCCHPCYFITFFALTLFVLFSYKTEIISKVFTNVWQIPRGVYSALDQFVSSATNFFLFPQFFPPRGGEKYLKNSILFILSPLPYILLVFFSKMDKITPLFFWLLFSTHIIFFRLAHQIDIWIA